MTLVTTLTLRYRPRRYNNCICSLELIKPLLADCSNSGMETQHLFWDDTYVFECNGVIIDIASKGDDPDELIIITNCTIMHPQGGKLLCTNRLLNQA